MSVCMIDHGSLEFGSMERVITIAKRAVLHEFLSLHP